ncbi:MAG: hypothetical protein WD942_02445 [Dehalococcoidia bacterium]
MAGDVVVYVIMVGTFIALLAGWWYSPREPKQVEGSGGPGENTDSKPPEPV